MIRTTISIDLVKNHQNIVSQIFVSLVKSRKSKHCGAANRILSNGSVQPRERIFMKNHNENIYSSHLNFSMGGHGCAFDRGGVRIILACEPEGFTSFLEKKTHFQGYKRGVQGWVFKRGGLSIRI